MKLNERSLVYYATNSSPADNTGFLYKKSERNTTYHRRWFVLKGNMLFYFDDKDTKEPAGAIILEGCTVELCESTEEFEFTFAIRFECAKSRPYVLAANSQSSMVTWVKAISRANFDYMRFVVNELQQKLDELQQAMTSGVVAQERNAYRKKKPLFISENVPRNTDHESALQQAVVCYNQVRENGCAVWNNTANADVVSNGHCPTVTWERPALHDGSFEENQKAPPLPPRRRKKNEQSCWTAEMQPNGPAPQGPLSFSTLHDWFGKEIPELRKEWMERQPKPEQ